MNQNSALIAVLRNAAEGAAYRFRAVCRRTQTVEVETQTDVPSGTARFLRDPVGPCQLTFDGTALVQAALNDTGQTHASVWYLDLADTGAAITGDIVLTWSGSDNGFYLDALSLYDVQGGGPIADDNGGNNTASDIALPYGTASIGDMIVESVGIQGETSSGAGSIIEPTGLSSLYNAFQSDGGGYGAAAGYESISAAGSASNTWGFTGINTTQRVRAAGVLFTSVLSVPEPSTFILSVLGLLSLRFVGWRRRRRA